MGGHLQRPEPSIEGGEPLLGDPVKRGVGQVEPVVLLVAEQRVAQLGDGLEQRPMVIEPMLVEVGQVEARLATQDADERHPCSGAPPGGPTMMSGSRVMTEAMSGARYRGASAAENSRYDGSSRRARKSATLSNHCTATPSNPASATSPSPCSRTSSAPNR